MNLRTFLRAAAGSLLVVMAANVAPQAVFGFSDLTASSPFSRAIQSLKDKGVVEGYADGTYRANDPVNRAEFLKIVLGSRLAVDGKSLGAGSNCFADVKTNDWFAAWVCTAKAEGIVSGYDTGDFKPEQNITFVEASKILALAFKQQGNIYGTDWYEQYVRTLEDSKAIPTSISALDKPVTRGEMAEMMWRLTDNVTDQPTKGFLNVKHPELAINTASDSLQTAKSCRDLQALASESGNGGFMNDGYAMRRGVMLEGAMAPTAANAEKSTDSAGAPPMTGGGTSGGDFSHTNVQVEGVDEGDVVKTDGTYLYIAGPSHGSKVFIVKAEPSASMNRAATIDLGNDEVIPQELYVDGDRLVVVSNAWAQVTRDPVLEDSARTDIAPVVGKMMYWPGGSQNRTEVRIYNVADHANPKLTRKVSFDGGNVSTRRIDDKLYLVMNRNLWWGGYPMPLANVKASAVTEADVGVPVFNDSATGGKDESVVRCGAVSILPHVAQPEYMIVAVVPLNNSTAEVKRELVVGSAQNVYASLKNLYVATPRWNYVWDGRGGNSSSTQLYRFEFTADGVDLKSQGSVPGTVLNQFSMDEYGESFRIATTKEATWSNDGKERPSTNNLYVLNRSLERVGEIEDIAPGESIHSVRFMGDRTYMVTFQQVDPLFVIDTSDARHPKILGKLKIPGYSDYLHPYDATHVIGFGKEVDESIDKDKVHTEGAVYYTAVLGMKVSMFDVSDVEHPKEMFKTVIGDRGTESPLLTDHHALLFEKDRNLLAFPVTVMSLPAGAKPTDESAYPTATFQGAYVYDISLNGMTLKGKISHYGEDAYLKSGDTWYPSGSDIERIVRVNDSLYTISPMQVQSHTEKDVKLEGKLEL
ncbi:MAG TPA: beta-propeller domain-containing protein [Candidatus Peribacteria bacterium]|nr:beta-propeller domain-containing protein [Candidatus Peribacteria bacterium]